MPLSTSRALALALASVVAAAPAVAQQDFTSAEQAQVVGLDGWSTAPLWTVGETIGGYVPPGIPDGTGALALNDRTVRIFVNHEVTDNSAYAYTLANGTRLRGSRVSYFDVDRRSRSLVGSGLAYDTIIDRYGAVVTRAEQVNEGQVGGFDDVTLAGIDRLCSANLFTAGEYGLVDDVFFTGEETGNGQEFALDVRAGVLHTAPWLGRAAWESATLLETGDDDTVAVLIGDDRGGAPLLLYVGTKKPGGFLERNGLAGGVLHVWVADSGETTPDEWNGTGSVRAGRFVAIDHYDASKAGQDGYDLAGFADMATQDSLAEAAGAFRFSRPEDVSTNPTNGTQAVMASTGRGGLFPGDNWGTTYLVDVDFGDAEGGVASTLTVLYDGDDAGAGAFADPDFGLRSPDNLDWADDGFVYVQEDRSTSPGSLFGGTSGEEASVWRLDPASPTAFTADDLQRIAQIDIDAVPNGQRENELQPNERGVRETSGVLDVTSLFETAPGEQLFILDVQAHEARAGAIADLDLVQGGQLLFMSSPTANGDIACTAGGPLSFSDYDAAPANGVGDDARGEFAELTNGSASTGASLAGCQFIAFNPFTERITYVRRRRGAGRGRRDVLVCERPRRRGPGDPSCNARRRPRRLRARPRLRRRRRAGHGRPGRRGDRGRRRLLRRRPRRRPGRRELRERPDPWRCGRGQRSGPERSALGARRGGRRPLGRRRSEPGLRRRVRSVRAGRGRRGLGRALRRARPPRGRARRGAAGRRRAPGRVQRPGAPGRRLRRPRHGRRRRPVGSAHHRPLTPAARRPRLRGRRAASLLTSPSMTLLPSVTPAPSPTAIPDRAPRPYTVPVLHELGSIASLTAGDESGSLDMLVGSDGGFGGEPTS